MYLQAKEEERESQIPNLQRQASTIRLATKLTKNLSTLRKVLEKLSELYYKTCQPLWSNELRCLFHHIRLSKKISLFILKAVFSDIILHACIKK